jgi:hypothetical protein
VGKKFQDHFLQLGPLSPECQPVHLAKNSKTHEHPTWKTEIVFTPLVLFYYIISHFLSDQSPDSQLNEQIPGAYSFGKAHFVFSISVRNALEQWHLFSSSVNLSMQKKYQQLAPAPWELLNK